MRELLNKDLEQFNAIIKLHKAITFFGSARLKAHNSYYQMAKDLAYKCVKEGFCVVSGAGGGIMEAANLGAKLASDKLEAKGKLQKTEKDTKSVGFNIFLPFEQKVNDFVGYNITFKSLAIRKMALIEKSLAFVIFPGGYGTLDEFLEVLTLKQLGFKEVPIFVLGKDFWRGFDDFIKGSLLKHKLISQDDIFAYELNDDVDDIIKKIKDYNENSSCNERGC